MLQTQLGAEYPESERARFLSDNCDRVENLRYLKAFTPADYEQLNADLSALSLEIDDIEQEKKEATALFRESLKPLKAKLQLLFQNHRNKGQRVDENCYVFFDHANNQVGYYNAEGHLVSTRTMKPGEQQRTLFQVNRGDEPSNRTGTND